MHVGDNPELQYLRLKVDRLERAAKRWQEGQTKLTRELAEAREELAELKMRSAIDAANEKHGWRSFRLNLWP